jgi:cell wall-associated NlpC family hydrolase
MRRDEALVVARQVALSLLNTPYIWGGDDPMRGFDCSGFVIEILKSVGLLPQEGDWTAEGLYQLTKGFAVDVNTQVTEGCLLFWHTGDGKATHVEYALNDTLSIGARGGGAVTSSLSVAIKENAYTKIRPWEGRGRPILAVTWPFFALKQ